MPIAPLLIAIWAVAGMGYFWPVIGFAFAALPALAMGNTRVIRSHGVVAGNARVIRSHGVNR